MSLYELVYGKEVVLLISMEIPALQLLKSLETKENSTMEMRLVELINVQEARENAHNALISRQ